MAQIDTGLGWSMDDAYATDLGPVDIGTMEVIGGPDYPNQPLAYASSLPDTVLRGMRLFTYEELPYTTERTFYASTENDTIPAFVCYIDDGTASDYNWRVLSNVSGASVRITRKIESSGDVEYQERGFAYTRDSATGLYYGNLICRAPTSSHSSNVNPDLPIFSTLEDALAAFQIIETHYYKLYPGYAAVCFAKWWTPAGVLITDPVIISSERKATTISLDGSTAPPTGQITESFVYEGKVFYMSYMLNSEQGTPISIFPINDLTQFGAALGSKVFQILASSSYANIQLTAVPPDPYNLETDPSEEEGGGGEDVEDDPVEEETLPIPAVAGLGFSTIYVPTQTDLYNLAAYLWGGNLDLDNFLKLFANPMDSILGLSAVPLVLSGTYEPIYLGGQLLQGITMPRYTGRTAVKVDMGTVTIKERWGAYLDYDPYTELAVYVPFVGIKNIKADDVMGKTIRLMYDIDILSGACIAYIRPEGESPLYEWSGQCAMQIPITGANWDNIFNSAIRTAATLGGALFAPASAPVLGNAVASAASQAIAAKPRIERSGAMNGVTGFLGQLRPYIIRTIPEAYIPNEQNRFIGYPSYVSVNLGSLTGYNEIASIHLENIPATGDELSELESILKGGAIF